MNTPEPRSTPWWETAAMIASFVLLWAYMLARQSALMAAARSGAASPRLEISPLWNVAQYVAIATLVFILMRRVKRARDAVREATQIRPGFPPGFVPTQPAANGKLNGRTPETKTVPTDTKVDDSLN